MDFWNMVDKELVCHS